MLQDRWVKLLFLLQVIATAAVSGYCDYYQYQTNDGCVQCPKCPIGQGVTINCGNNGQSGDKCKPCDKGHTFSSKPSIECEDCQICGVGKLILSECTQTSDTVCVSQCPNNYVASNNRCVKIPTTKARTELVSTSLPFSNDSDDRELTLNSTVSSTKHVKTEQFVPSKFLRVAHTTKPNILTSAESSYIFISVASIFVLFVSVPTIIYVIKKRENRNQSHVRRSRDQIRKEDEDLVEVHVTEKYQAPNQPPVVGAVPIDPNLSTTKSTIKVGAVPIDPNCSTPHSTIEGDQAHDCNNETKKEVIKKNCAKKIFSQQSYREQETAVQKLNTNDDHLNDKLALAKKSLNKLLDNQFKTLNVSREENVTSSGVDSVPQNLLNKENEPQRSLICECQQESNLNQHCMLRIPDDKVTASINETESITSPSNGFVQKQCIYRPINRRVHNHCETCLECCPQDSDFLVNIIERYCLKEEVCDLLNTTTNKSWKNLLTLMRQDKMIAQLLNNRDQNPAFVTIDKLLASRPKLTFGAFKSMMNEIERPDIGHIMEHHHFNCDTCRRNIFDEPKMCICQLA